MVKFDQYSWVCKRNTGVRTVTSQYQYSLRISIRSHSFIQYGARLDEFILPQLLTLSICWDSQPLSVPDALSRLELSHGLPPKRICILSGS